MTMILIKIINNYNKIDSNSRNSNNNYKKITTTEIKIT